MYPSLIHCVIPRLVYLSNSNNEKNTYNDVDVDIENVGIETSNVVRNPSLTVFVVPPLTKVVKASQDVEIIGLGMAKLTVTGTKIVELEGAKDSRGFEIPGFTVVVVCTVTVQTLPVISAAPNWHTMITIASHEAPNLAHVFSGFHIILLALEYL